MPNYELPSWTTQEDDRLGAERIPLSPSGISPWQHSVELTPGGQLCLYWTHGGTEHLRMFSREETLALSSFLYDRRQQICFPLEQEQTS